MSARWVRRRVGIGMSAAFLAVTLSPVLAALVGAPMATGDPADPIPTVQVPPSLSALIGESVAFDVSFWNASPTQPGYGPYVDLKLPAGDDTDDGLSFTSATYLGAAVTSTELVPDGLGCAPHPYALDASGKPVQICGIAPGEEYWVLRLPFGSFTPGQPSAVVHVTTKLSQDADVGLPLEIDVSGGFQFGRTPLDDPTQGDPSTLGAVVTTDLTPTIMRVSKSYNGPESETATGPDYPRSYRIDVTIAPGQTVDDVTITDALPDTIQYVSTDTPADPFTSITEPSTSTPGGQLVIDFGSVTGTGGTDASATFNFYVPLLDSAGQPVLDPATGAFNTSTDSVTAAGKWSPLDPLDGTDIDVAAGPATHTLHDKSIAIQKSVGKIGGGEVGPGDVLQWTINIQVSDYFAFDDLIVDDLMGNTGLGDGTTFDYSFVPTLAVSGNVSLPAQGMSEDNYQVSSADGAGKTPIRFNLSDELITRGRAEGSLVGNCVGLGGSATPDCSAHSDGATTAQIVFHTIVQRTYVKGNEIVEGDTLDNVASAYGDVLDDATLQPNGNSVGDGGPGASPAGTAASILIQRGSLTKSIYAINGNTTPPSPVHVSPGDTVTYRLRQTFPASRTDDFSITDFLPLPVFFATDMTNGFDAGAPVGTIPAAGHANYGPADDFHTRCSSDTPVESCPDAPAPAVSFDSTANSVTFSYGNYALYPAGSSDADILFTVKVSTHPFADGLLLTNQARSQTSNSVGTVVNADAIVQITLDQPVLAITKGVVGTDNPAGVFAPVTPGAVAFTATSAPTGSPTCPAFTDGPVTNARLTDNPATDPLDQDLAGVDAGDYVRYAVVVQDTGHAAAFNVKVQDEIPAGMHKPASGFDMCITNGAGTAIAATNISDGLDIGGGDQLFAPGDTGGIQLTDPSVDGDVSGALAAGTSGGGVDNAAGTNMAIITYTLQVDTSAVPTSVITNTATLIGFANDPTSDNHLGAPLTDDATVTLGQPAIDKTLESTGQGNGTAVAIGERVTYKVTLTLPEGTLPNARVVDQLPAGLGFTGCQTITPSSGITTDHAGGFDDVCANPTVVGVDGPQVTFGLGQIDNADAINADPDTITIVYDTVVLNTAGNNRGTSLQNGATFYWDGGTVASVGPASAPAVVVHEPQLSIQKDASSGSGDAFDSIDYTITISNPSAIDDPNGGAAFDVVESDAIPAGMTYDGSVPFAQDPDGPAVASLSVSGGVLNVTWDRIAQGETAVLRYSVKIDANVAPGATLPNTATLTWTSLPGSVSGERTGNASDPGGAVNDYRTSDGATIDVPAVTVAKSVVATDQPTTTGDNVTIGEIVTYQVVLTVPEGVALNSSLVDSLPAGLAFAGCDAGNPIVATSGVSTDLAGSWADACDAGKNLAVANGGRDLTFGLGTVTNGNINAETPATITITYDAVVLNVPSNVRGQTLQNGAEMFWQDAGSATLHSNTAAAAVTVVEPLMAVAKSADKLTGDAGDTITFSVTITNPTDALNHQGTDAFDVDWSDTLPAGLDYSAVNYAIETTTCATPPTGLPSAVGNSLAAHWNTFPEGGSCTIQYQAVLAGTVAAGSSYTNAAGLTWTSLPGVHNTLPGLSTYSDLSTERTGSVSDPGAAANNYSQTSTVTVNVVQPAPVKSVVATSEAGTAGTSNVEIGETVRYQVYVTIPEGITDGVSIRDTLSSGLRYLNDGSTRIALVSNGAGMTSSAVPDADSGSALYQSGADTWPALGNHPTYAMPGGAISGGSGGAGALNGFQSGDDPIFDLGTVTNSDRDGDSELVVIEFNVLVDNVIGNQNGTSLSDRAAIWADPPLPATQTPAKLKDSNGPLTQKVVEPAMTLTKTITTAPVDAGDGIVYRISVTNSSATAPAYDYQILDTIPAALVSPPSSIVITCGAGPNPNASSGALIDVTFGEVAPGATCTVDVTTTVVTTEPAGETFTNTADATYSSLPGLTGTDEAGGNATGSTHSADSGTATGERTGSGGINDYTNTGNVDQTLAAPSIVKWAPSLADAPIGAESTFDIVVTLPEGTTRGLVVTDTLPDGLDFVSATPVTSGGRLGAAFSGTFTDSNPTPAVTQPDGAHHAYALTFGDTVVPVDGLTGNEQFEVQVLVRVANVAGNQAGTVLWNAANLTYTDGATPVDVAAPAQQSVTIVEPDVRLTKSVSSTTPYFGDTVTYTLTLSHGNGADDVTAYDVTLVDTLPVAAGWTYAPGKIDATGCPDADASTPSYSAGVITTTFASFAPGETCTITYQATIGGKLDAPLGSTYTNTAVTSWTSLSGPSDYERTGSALDPGGVLNDYTGTATATATVTGVDLAVSKDDGTPTAIAAQVNKYTIGYQNNGNVTASGVVLTETVPAGTTFNLAGSTNGTWLLAGGGAVPNGAAAGTVCHINIGNVVPGVPGASSRIFAVAVVDPIASGRTQIINTATIADDGTHRADATAGDNTTTDTDTIPQADLSLTKTVDVARPGAGKPVVYTITLTNSGPDDATGVQVKDLVPTPAITYSSYTASQGTYNSGTGIWTVTGTVAAGTSKTLTIHAVAATSATATNTAEVTHSADGDPDSTPNNHVGTEDDQATAVTTPLISDPAVTKTVDNATPDEGTDVTFTITARNNSGDSADNVKVVDTTAPAGLTFVSATPSQGSWLAGTWTVGTLANGASATMSLVEHVTSAGLKTNTAVISSDSFDSNAGNNSASATVSQSLDLAVSKSVDDSAPNVGDQVTFTVGVAGSGTNTAHNVLIHDALPAGLAFVSAAAGQGSYDSVSGNWTVGTIASGASPSLTIVATVTGNAAMTNTASVLSLDESQTSLANDSATATVTPQRADLAVAKVVDNGGPEIGSPVVFTVTVDDNIGPDGATNVAITDALPAGLTFVSATPSQGGYVSGTGIWTVGSLAKNASATLTVTATVAIGGSYTNTAAVSASDQYDPVSANNTASASLTSRMADIGVAKTVDKPTPDVGATVTYTVTATNHGPDPASQVILGDLLPAGLSFVSATPSQGSYTAGTGQWSVGSLALNAQATLSVAARVMASGSIDNTASLTSLLQTDSNAANNSATATITVTSAADLAVTKTPSTTRPDVGSDVTYTIVATNNGPDDATGVTVSDPLPAGLTFVSATPPAGTSYAGGTWTIGNLANGASISLPLVATVGVAGTIANTATIAGTEFDPVAANNSATATVDQRVDLVVSKSVLPLTPNVGTNATFTIHISNTGPNTANHVVISDALPTGLTYVSDTGAGAYDQSTGEWSVGSMASGGAASLDIVARVDSQAPVTNTASVNAVDETQSDTTNDSATATVTPPWADLEVTKTVDNPIPEMGDTVVFTVVVENLGPDGATNVTVHDALPADITWVSDDSDGDYDHATGDWAIGSIADGASATMHVTATVDVRGDYTNTAAVSHSDQYDPVSGNNTDDAFLTTKTADVGVTKTVDHPTPAVGTVVSYTVTATNTGEYSATGLVIHDALPAGRLTFVSASADTGSYDATTGDWTIGTLAVDAVAILTLDARVIDSGKIDNTAAVSAMLQRDTNPDNNSATAQIDAPPAADLSLTKTVDNDTPDKDSNVTFTVTVTNSGPDDTTGVVVADALPAGLTYVSDDGGTVGPDPAYDPATGHWTVGGLNAGDHATLHITATVDVGETKIVNTAEVTHSDLPDPDSTPANGVDGEDDQATAMLNARGVADLAIKKTVSPARITKGQRAVYTLVITNLGPQDATGVIVRDQLPTPVTFVSVTGGTYDSKTGAWTVGSLGNGESATLKITVIVGKTGAITNVADIVAADQRDPNSSNDESTAGVTGAGPTPATTAAGGSGPLPGDPGALALWLLAIAFAAIALLGAAALASRNYRLWLRR